MDFFTVYYRSFIDIILDFDHNHSINSADALRYRPVSEDCKIIFLELFSPKKYKEDIRISGLTNLPILWLIEMLYQTTFGFFIFMPSLWRKDMEQLMELMPTREQSNGSKITMKNTVWS